MEYSVIDKRNMYQARVRVNEQNIPLQYQLKQGDQLVDIVPPSGLIPTLHQLQKDGTWKNLATSEQEREYYQQLGMEWPPVEPEPTNEEDLLETVMDLDYRMTMLELGL